MAFDLCQLDLLHYFVAELLQHNPKLGDVLAGIGYEGSYMGQKKVTDSTLS